MADGINITCIPITVPGKTVMYEFGYRIGNTPGEEFEYIRSSTPSFVFTNALLGVYDFVTRAVTTRIEGGQTIDTFSDISDDYIRATVTRIIPGIPIGLRAEPSPTSIKLTWNAVPNANSYFVRYRVEGTTDYTVRTFNTNSGTITGLTHNTNYEIAVALETDINGNPGVYGDTITVRTTIEIPRGLAAGAHEPTSIPLTWNAVTDVDSYTVRYRIQGTTNYQTRTFTSNSGTLTGLTPESVYEIGVRSNVGSDSGDYSTDIRVRTTIEVPTGLMSGDLARNSIPLTWNTVTGADSYTIRYRVEGTTNYQTAVFNTNSGTLTGLVFNRTYEIGVRGNVGSRSGAYSTNITAVTGVVVPTGLTAGTATLTTIPLTWNAVNGANFYTVRYRAVGDTSYLTRTFNTNSGTIRALTQATDYEIGVRAIEDMVNSEYSSNIVSGTIIPTPTWLAAGVPERTSIPLSWAAVDGATSYTVRYRVQGTTRYTTRAFSANSGKLTGLALETIYDISVRAGSRSRSGDYSNIVSVATGIHYGKIGDAPIDSTGIAWNGQNFYVSTRSNLTRVDMDGNDTLVGNFGSLITNVHGIAWDSGAGKLRVIGRFPGLGTIHTLTLNIRTGEAEVSFDIATERELTKVSGILAGFAYRGGNYYLTGSSAVYEEESGVITRILTLSSDARNPTGLSEDGATGLYLVNQSGVYQITNVTSRSPSERTVGGLPNGLVDPQGITRAGSDLYVVDGHEGGVWRLNPTNTSAVTVGTPTNLVAGIATPTRIPLTWNAVDGATSYTVRYRVSGTTSYSTSTFTETSGMITGLNPDNDYDISINAVGASNTSAYSSNIDTRTSLFIPIPTGLTAGTATPATIPLTWNAVNGADSYTVRYRVSGATNYQTSTFTESSGTLTGLPHDTEYEIGVRALDSVRTGDYSTDITARTAIPAPTGLTAGTATPATIPLTWNEVTDADSYTVRYRIGSSGSYQTTSFTGASGTLTGLTPDSSYEIGIRTVLGLRTSDYSTDITTRTLPVPVPTGLVVDDATETTASVDWDDVVDATAYNVECELVVLPVSAPTGLVVESTTDTTASVDWDDVAGADAYNVEWEEVT